MLPTRNERIAIVGHTGSGKTVFAAWVLARAGNLSRTRWVVIDYKYDTLLNSIDKTRELSVNDHIPSKSGLYLVHPMPHQESQVEEFLWRVWRKENTGVYVDEAHMLPDKGALQALLTQGRSKQIPMITLIQRPVKVNRFVISEADYYSMFHLNDHRDRLTVRSFVNADISKPIPQYHSRYHIVKKNLTTMLKPVPKPDIVAQMIEDQLRPNTWW